MDGFELYSKRIGNDLIDLIPRHGLVRSNMNGLSDRVNVTHQTNKSLGKIAIVRHGP
ncbi:hypothetical protein D3C84_1299560 [compost metagenome]